MKNSETKNKIENFKLKRKKQPKEREKANYIKNADFLAEIIEYRKLIKAADGARVPVPDSLAIYFLKLARNLSSKGNFLNYTYKEDMVADGIENCIQYVHNFNPKKSKNPFSYFTQIIYYAFVRRIKKEKKQLYVKYKSFMNSELSDNEEILNMIQKNDALKDYKREFIDSYEKSIEAAKQKNRTKTKKKSKTLDLFFELTSDDKLL